MIRIFRTFMGLLAVITMMSASSALAQDEQSDDVSGIVPPEFTTDAEPRADVVLPEMRRTIRRFDFEERSRQPFDFPIGWYRIGPTTGGGASQPGRAVQQTRPGHPLFGSMTFSDESHQSGDWSFMFDLHGGSMTAALAPTTLPIIPGGDYIIAAWIRTAGLRNARARVATLFYDQYGDPIEGSRIESNLIITDGKWQRIAIELSGQFNDAANLVVELQLLQPKQFDTREHRPNDPILEDVSGRVWFDDIEIFHLPRIELSVCDGPQVVVAPDVPRVRIALTDLASDPLEGRLRIEDVSGNAVVSRSMAVRRGRSTQVVDLDTIPFGWYKITMDLIHEGQRIGGNSIKFAYLPHRLESKPNTTLMGVNLETLSLSTLPQSTEVMRRAAIRAVVMPIWDHTHGPDSGSGTVDRVRPSLESLLDLDSDVVFTFPLVPESLAAELQLDPTQVMEMFEADEAILRPYLEDILIAFGQRVGSWQLGATSFPSGLPSERLADATDRAWRALARLVPGPHVVLPWSALQPLPIAGAARSAAEEAGNFEPTEHRGFHLLIPYYLQPQWIGTALQQAIASGQDIALTLQPLARDSFTPRERTIDIAIRALHAARSGAPQMYLAEPWDVSTGRDVAEPDPTLTAWLQVADAIGSRSFAGEVSYRRGAQCWLFDHEGDSVLVAWNETNGIEDAFINAQLASGPIDMVDLDGNHTRIDLIDGHHHVPLTDRPVFLMGIDRGMVLFRQGFRIEPSFARSVPREHEFELVIVNPWDSIIAGTVRFAEPRAWTFSPRRINFAIPPKGEVRLPFSLVFGRAVESGPTEIVVEFDIGASEHMKFRMAADFEVSLDYLQIEPTWRLVSSRTGPGSDIVVSVYMTNTGSRPIALEAYVLAPGYSRMRRPVSLLAPGETALKSFHLVNGGDRLGGKSIRIGVGEIDNPERLNRILVIPDLTVRASAQSLSGN